ncbi:hypothetical protein BXZ70DRAFT_911754, partial [Cristinia sonorae]
IPQTPSRAAAKARQNTPHPVKSAQSTASKYRRGPSRHSLRIFSDDSMEEAPRLSARAKGKAKAVEIFSSDDNMDVSVDETTDLISKVALKTPVSNKKAMRRNYEHSRGRDSPMYSTGGDDDEWSMREPGDNLPAPLKSAKKKVTVMTPPSPSPEKKIKAKSYSRKRRASTSEENDDNVPEEKVHATPSKIKKTSERQNRNHSSSKARSKLRRTLRWRSLVLRLANNLQPSKSKKTLPPADQIFLSDEEKQPSFDLKVKGVQSKLKKAFPREAVGDPNENPWVLFRHKDTNEPYYPFDCVALKQFAEDRRLKDAGSDQMLQKMQKLKTCQIIGMEKPEALDIIFMEAYLDTNRTPPMFKIQSIMTWGRFSDILVNMAHCQLVHLSARNSNSGKQEAQIYRLMDNREELTQANVLFGFVLSSSLTEVSGNSFNSMKHKSITVLPEGMQSFRWINALRFVFRNYEFKCYTNNGGLQRGQERILQHPSVSGIRTRKMPGSTSSGSAPQLQYREGSKSGSPGMYYPDNHIRNLIKPTVKGRVGMRPTDQ